MTEEFLILEQIKPINKETFNNILKNLDFDEYFTKLFLLFFFLILIVINYLNMRPLFKKRKSISLKFFLKNFLNRKWNFVYSLSAIGIFFFFFDLHLFFVKLIVTNNIKTSKVILDTTNIIKDEQDVLNTKKVSCDFSSKCRTILFKAILIFIK